MQTSSATRSTFPTGKPCISTRASSVHLCRSVCVHADVSVYMYSITLLWFRYGTSWIHMFNKKDGTYKSSFGGRGKTSADPIKFSTPHSLSADPRFPGQLLVTDRSNERLVYVNESGGYKSSIDVSKGGSPAQGSNSLPCSSHFMTDAKAGMVALIPGLGDSKANFSTSGSVGSKCASNPTCMIPSQGLHLKIAWGYSLRQGQQAGLGDRGCSASLAGRAPASPRCAFPPQR